MSVAVTYLQAVLIGILQGVTELFPVSSLGHSVILPALLGWTNIVSSESGESFYLAFLVGLHTATAVALIFYFRDDWFRIVRGLLRVARTRKADDKDGRLGILLVIGTIPVGLVGLIFEHPLRVLFAKPLAAAIFLTINGVILLLGEWLRQRDRTRFPPAPDADPDRNLAALSYPESAAIGSAQILALFAGISRSGTTMVAGLLRGLDHEDAARFSFLLATPIILAAGLYKIPDLTGPLGKGLYGQIIVGSIAAAAAAYLSVHFLVRYFRTRTLTPMAIYCLIAGTACTLYFTLK